MADAPRQQDPYAIPPNSSGDTFVRTFATDAQALQAGQVPDFMRRAAESATGPLPTPVSAPSREDILAKLDAAAREQGPALDLGTSPALPSITPPQETFVPPKNIEAGETVIHTYKADFADEAKDTGASTFSMVAAEQDATRTPAPALPQKLAKVPSPNLLIAALVLIFLGLVSAGGAYWYISRPGTVVVATLPPTRIFVDDRQALTGSGNTLMAEVVTAVAAPLAANSIKLLSVSTASATTSLFAALALPAPSILLRNINTEGSMAGVVDANGVQSAFFLLSVASYSDTFAGMLAWEPSLPHDLAALYPASATQPASPATASSTASSTVPSAPPIALVFHDQVVLNHDVRLLKDASGKTVMLYGYFDPATLIIARDESAFAVILDRLTNSRTQQ